MQRDCARHLDQATQKCQDHQSTRDEGEKHQCSSNRCSIRGYRELHSRTIVRCKLVSNPRKESDHKKERFGASKKDQRGHSQIPTYVASIYITNPLVLFRTTTQSKREYSLKSSKIYIRQNLIIDKEILNICQVRFPCEDLSCYGIVL